MFESLRACQPAFPLLLRHLVNLVQLPHRTLLIGRGQLIETGIAAKYLLLSLRGKIAMLIEPIAQMPGWLRAGITVGGAGLSAIR